MGCIYQYVNKVNGHMYIGYTTQDPKRRFSDHLSSSYNPKSKDYNEAIHRAIRKHGIDNFDFNIIEDNLDTVAKCKEREQYWIKFYNTYENREHYNETPGGDCPGYNTVHLGETHGMARLTEEQVKYCRKCYQEGKRSRDIYNELQLENVITYSGFLRMWHGKSWKHVMPEAFEHNPHRGRYTAKDRDIICERFDKSHLSVRDFAETEECYVGYGTLWKMLYQPEFYDGK